MQLCKVYLNKCSCAWGLNMLLYGKCQFFLHEDDATGNFFEKKKIPLHFFASNVVLHWLANKFIFDLTLGAL